MSAHTPTPGLALPLKLSGTGFVLDANGHMVGDGVYGDGAKTIVRACNSHAALVETLQKALVCLKPPGRPEREEDPYYGVICEIRAALALAGEA